MKDFQNNPGLATHAVHKRFGALVVLDDVNFSMEMSDAVGIVGPNGAGKTTLLNVLAGTFAPSSGSVVFADTDITTLSAPRRCRLGLARSHQIPKPFAGMSTFENVYVAASFGARVSRAHAYDLAADALKFCGMLDVANRPAASLGLLDRKRLELARAMATQPRILLLDEIGGGLTDAEASELVAAILELRRRDIGIIWIEHIVHMLVQATDRLICMDAGAIIADGAPDVVMSDETVISAYLGGAPE